MQPRHRTLPAPAGLSVPGATAAPVEWATPSAPSSFDRGHGLVDVVATVAALG